MLTFFFPSLFLLPSFRTANFVPQPARQPKRHQTKTGLGAQNDGPPHPGGDQLRMLLSAVVRRVRHHAAGAVPATLLCHLPQDAVLCGHLAGDGHLHPRTAAAVPGGE